MLEKQLAGTASPRLKGQALFVLAQINTPRAREVLTNIAKGSAIPELQNRAIQYLGVHGGRESRATLAEIYASSTDVDVEAPDPARVHGRRREGSPADRGADRTERRSCAPRPSGSWARWAPTTSSGRCIRRRRRSIVKRSILSAMQVSGNAARMVEIARTEKDADLRRLAVRNLGVMGGSAPPATRWSRSTRPTRIRPSAGR